MKPGRNDPCPCGSGRKYKKCCALQEADDDLIGHRLRRAESAVVDQTLAFARQRYGAEILLQAWREYIGGVEETSTDHPLFESSFIPWLAFNWLFDPATGSRANESEGAPLAWLYSGSPGCRLDSFERRFAELMCDRPYSFYTVTAVDAGHSMSLEDIMTGTTTTVFEQSASRTVRPGAVLYTRFLAMDGAAIMSGCAPLMIPPEFRLRLLDLRDSLRKIDGVLTDAHLHVLDARLRQIYLMFADELYNPRPPSLANTDGDPLAPTTLHFDLRCTPQEAFDALRSLGIDELVDTELEDAQRDSSGALRSVRFDWSKRGNRLHKEWDNTTLGNLHIEAERLTVSVNSERRAKRIRKEVEARLGERVAFKRAVIESLEKALEESFNRPATAKEQRRRQEDERLNALPEVQAKLREMAAAHWAGWLDEKLPALDNRTPRQASRTAKGRERLEALLQQFEWTADGKGDQPFVPNVAALRAQLGLGGKSRDRWHS